MNIPIKTIILLATVILTGLSAGLFYAWQVSVIPGTKKVFDHTYIEVMQSINRAILNPAFFLIFFGSLFLLSITSIYEFHSNKWVFKLFSKGVLILAVSRQLEYLTAASVHHIEWRMKDCKGIYANAYSNHIHDG